MKKPEHEPCEENALYWSIQSQSEPDTEHLVYLGANDGRGRCMCVWHRAEVQPAYDQKGTPRRRTKGSMPLTCHHVEQAHKRYHLYRIWTDIQTNPNHDQDGKPNNSP